MIVIAEIGVNHGGSFSTAQKMIEAAKESGADYVKFQIFDAGSIVTKNARAADYQKKNTANQNLTQYELLKSLELTHTEFKKLRAYCDRVNIGFLATAFSISDVNFLVSLAPDFMKIPSGEITNLPLLEAISKSSIPVLLSTGMSYMSEVEEAVNILTNQDVRKSDIVILQCVSDYPANPRTYNLRAMTTMGERCETKFGLSDHSTGYELAIAAVAMGASVLEKHFTLDQDAVGPDHKASLNAEQFRCLVESVRTVESALGDGQKAPSSEELCNRSLVRRSIVASRDISIGEIFSEDNLTTKRPGTGISPVDWYEIVGTKSTRAYSKDEAL